MLLFVLLLLLNYCKSCNLYGFGKKKNVLIVLKAAQVLNLKTPNRINKQFFAFFRRFFLGFGCFFAIVSHPLHSTSAAAVCGNGNAKLTESAASFWFAFFVFFYIQMYQFICSFIAAMLYRNRRCRPSSTSPPFICFACDVV